MGMGKGTMGPNFFLVETGNGYLAHHLNETGSVMNGEGACIAFCIFIGVISWIFTGSIIP